MSGKADAIRSWALSQVGCPYIMGGTGASCTVAYRQARAKQYPGSAARITANCPRLKGSAASCASCRWYDGAAKQGKRAYDCAQLTRWCMNSVGISLVSGATSQWNKTAFEQKGPIDQMPQDQVCLLYRQDSASTMGHTGIYLGDGTVVHAKSHADGVVREALGCGNRFTHFGIPAGLRETANAPAETTFSQPTTDVGALLFQIRLALSQIETYLQEHNHAAG
ncbi:MAG: C40 family peptidase [Clostridia bacterium]|nr:C40 family peptidase [Clostridia bacterium]